MNRKRILEENETVADKKRRVTERENTDNERQDIDAMEPTSRTVVVEPQEKAVITDDDNEEIAIAVAEELAQEAEKQQDQQTVKQMSLISVEKAANKLGDTWEKGAPTPYAVLCKTFEHCESTTKRLEITEYLVALFIKIIHLSPNDLLTAVYMCVNKLCPDYEGLELGIGESLIMKAIAQSYARNMKQIQDAYHKEGDLGKVAVNSKQTQTTLGTPKPLTLPNVFKYLREIAKLSGSASQNQKIGIIRRLLVACRGNEAKYIIRQLEGKLRIGLAEQTVLTALAQAAVLSKKGHKHWSSAEKEKRLTNAVETLKSVYNQLPNYDMIVPALLQGIRTLKETCTMRPGIPLKPMLAHPTKSLTEVLDRFQDQAFTCEFKYDGERAQIHCLENGSIQIYSRNSEDNTTKYPDIASKIRNWHKPSTKSYILDCEAVAWDIEKKCILPFQILTTRKRKAVKEEDIKVRVAIFAFDCLYLNGQSLLQESLEIRRQKLKEAFEETENEFYFAKSMDSTEIEDIQHFLDVSIGNNCEGLMVKLFSSPDATYEPSKRSRNWLKVKKDYLAGVGDTLDLVVLGAFKGRGKRTNVYGSFLLGCYDESSDKFQTVCKIGTGFSDENLQNFYNTLKDLQIEKPRSDYEIGEHPEVPDVWFNAKIVWEVQCADLSISPRYMAGVGIVDEAKGISLRFPRFLRVRDDKEGEQCTGSEQIVDLYESQLQAS
ncbi:ATP-dependent DNA ligase [Dichotomocladium elegans]|nr:ATP-dependent DNA ligase [Dichotomocladium elegans]